MNTQAHIYVIGDVIGIGFRAWTKIQAKELKIHGWVRNCFDKPEVFGKHGGVETVIQGSTHQVNEMVERIKQGPSIARIDDVEVYWQDVKEYFHEFSILK